MQDISNETFSRLLEPLCLMELCFHREPFDWEQFSSSNLWGRPMISEQTRHEPNINETANKVLFADHCTKPWVWVKGFEDFVLNTVLSNVLVTTYRLPIIWTQVQQYRF